MMYIKFEINIKLPVICFLCLLSERFKEVTNAVRDEYRHTKDSHDFEYGPADLKIMLYNRNEIVVDDSNMNLIESDKVNVASVKDLARQRLVGELVVYGGHAENDGFGVDGVESTMQLNLLRDMFGLDNCEHVKGKLLKDAMDSESIGLRQHPSDNGLMTIAEVFGLLAKGNCRDNNRPEASATHKLVKHQNHQIVPMGHRSVSSFVVILGEYEAEQPLRKVLYCLCQNKYLCMHIRFDF